MPGMRIGIDTGGTFTDVAVLGRQGLRVHKLPSTPDDPARAVIEGLSAVRGSADVDVVHGTTVGLNAVLTGSLARTAFITNRGFEDLIEIGRQDRSNIYDLGASRTELPVPRSLRFGVDTRRTAGGQRQRSPSKTDLEELLRKVRRARPEAIAIGLLHSYANPADERKLARALAPLGVPITCSSELLRSHGEYERFAAAIINAAVTPIMSDYLNRLEQGTSPGRLRLMRSSGGIMPAAEASNFPARAIFSGPAGGVLAVRQLAQNLNLGTVAALDMGGTSTDVSLVQSEPTASSSSELAGLPLALPAVDVHTVGCGGGSIAHVDAGGALRVGPHSAGATPGPACYGQSDEPTVTDAHMALGHMGADTLLEGAFQVDPDMSVRAIERLAQRLGTSSRRAAEGILEIAEVAMLRALLVITVERAIDPAAIPLVAFGGAGGLHAARLAQRLSMPRAVIAADPGAFSAVGLALAGESDEETLPILRETDDLAASELRAIAADLAGRTKRRLLAQGRGARITTQVDAMMRFAGQGDCVRVPLRSPLEPGFRAEHERLFGFLPESSSIELVELRARSQRQGPALPDIASRASRGQPEATGRRKSPVGGTSWKRYRRTDLRSGHKVTGPCLIEELTGVTIVPRGYRCRVKAGALILDGC